MSQKPYAVAASYGGDDYAYEEVATFAEALATYQAFRARYPRVTVTVYNRDRCDGEEFTDGTRKFHDGLTDDEREQLEDA